MISIVLGSTGAVGRELIQFLTSSSKYSKILLPLRNPLPEWEKMPENQKSKLKILKMENFDFLKKSKEEITQILEEEKIDSFFNCLGSVTAKGEEELRKVDKEYAIDSAELCEKLSIDHYSIISSRGSSLNSCILYLRVKAEAEEEILKKNVKFIDIFQPGFIKERANARCGEKFMGCFCTCCYPCVHVKSLAKAIMLFDLKLYDSDDVEKKNINDGYKRIVSNEEILNIVMEK
jgi:hypothetical protein